MRLSSPGELQTLSRGLKALAFLNENGLTDLTTLARHLGVPRTNAYRIVNTLIADGYCLRIPNSRLYQAAPKAGLLSKGVQEGEILTWVSIGVIEKLGTAVKWPVTLTTPHGSGMLVRMTTDRTTSLALERFNPGFVAGMLWTTTGLLYLALERPEISEALIDDILAKASLDSFSIGEFQLRELLESCRRNGYLVLITAFPEACIGVPIVIDGRPIGGIVMRYIKSAVTETMAIETYLPQLQEAVVEIIRLHRIASEQLHPAPT